MKRAWSRSRSGSESVSQRYGSADPDLYQNCDWSRNGFLGENQGSIYFWKSFSKTIKTFFIIRTEPKWIYKEYINKGVGRGGKNGGIAYSREKVCTIHTDFWTLKIKKGRSKRILEALSFRPLSFYLLSPQSLSWFLWTWELFLSIILLLVLIRLQKGGGQNRP
jgi:hypothetical protein